MKETSGLKERGRKFPPPVKDAPKDRKNEIKRG